MYSAADSSADFNKKMAAYYDDVNSVAIDPDD